MSFKGFVKVNYFIFVIITVLSIICGLSIIGAGYIQMYWLTAIKDEKWRDAILYILLMVISWSFTYVFIKLAQYLNNKQEEEYYKQIRDRIAVHYFKDGKYHKISAFQNRITNDINIVNENYFEWYIALLIYTAILVSALVALITIHWSIFLICILLDVVSYYVPKLVQKRLQHAVENLSSESKYYLDTLEKWFSGLEELRRYCAGGKLLQVENSASKKVERANVKKSGAQQILLTVNGVCSVFSQIILAAITGFLITQNVIIFGAIVSVQNFMSNVSIGMQQMIQSLSYMKSAQPLMKEIGADATVINDQTDRGGEIPASIKTRGLMLQFPNGEKLTFPNLEINQGEKILLTGDSGAGKSTLFKLILGSIKPTSGKVEFENKAGKQIKPDMSKIGYIPQEPNLFPGTIEQNITMFNDNLDSKVKPIITEVDFKQDIAKFKNGLNEVIDLNKLNISGGQRQKIVLARAKIHDSNIILIDEGTSAIDQKATMDILQKLVKSDATIVFIAHNFNEKMRSLFDREIHLVKE